MKIITNKKGEKFEIGLFIVVAAISLSLFSFMTEENAITGFVTNSLDNSNTEFANLIEFDDVNSLSTLSAGNYYIDENGIVYWVDDELSPAVAKVGYFDENQKNRYIYIDSEGRIGYILEPAVIENEPNILQ